MNASSSVENFLTALAKSCDNRTFVGLSMTAHTGQDQTLKSLLIKPVLIKGQEKFSVTFRHKQCDIVKNFTAVELVDFIRARQPSFRLANLRTTQNDFILEAGRGGTLVVKVRQPSQTTRPDLSHDRKKQRIMPQSRPYLHSLGITDESGNVLKSAQDKYRQIDKFIETVAALLREGKQERTLRVLDMGSGKGYLTFALYDYLQGALGIDADVTGIERRDDMVGLCNRIAGDNGFSSLRFKSGSIADCDASGTDLLLALHACDTATDDAIAKGIAAGSRYIMVAPCCHKQIRREMEASKNPPSAELGFVLDHGIFRERQAEMVTDALRALILNYFGYKTQVFEFISDVHTPKNVMIVARKTSPGNDPAILKRISDAKDFFGIRNHHLETLTGLGT